MCIVRLPMDVETGVTVGKGDGELVVFTDIVYKLPSSLYDRFKTCRRGIDSEDCRKTILNGVCGAFRPAALTFILGPSGAGKSTLLQIIAGRRRAGVSGKVRGAGRGTVLVAQHGALIAALTARETLLFAASLKLSRLHARAREHAVQEVTTQLGIESCMNTRTSQMSGGECKRLCIATELLTNPAVLLLDEPTSGLDSVSSLSVIRALTSVARGGRTVACVLHQPASRLYAAADDVLLLSDGRTLYSGSRSEAPAALIRAGFECPQYYNPADFLLELTSGEQEGDLNKLESEARAYAYQLEQTCKRNLPQKNGKVPEAEALLVVDNIVPARKYDASTSIQLRSLLWRCCVGAIRDVHLTQIRIACHILVAFLLGALYNGAGADAARVTSNTACIFFFLLFLYFSNTMPTIHTFPVEAEVVQQEHLNHWYSLPAYCASKLIADLPVQLVCATVFCVPAWMLTSQPSEAWRLALMWGVCVLLTILAQTLGLVAGAACGVKMGLFAVPAANIPMLMFSDFFIPYKEIPSYLKPLSNISYFRYAFDASMHAVYGFEREPLQCSEDFCLFRHPNKYLFMLGLTGDYTKDIYALVIWILLAQIALVVVLFIKLRLACK